jgi:hypothetical protein
VQNSKIESSGLMESSLLSIDQEDHFENLDLTEELNPEVEIKKINTQCVSVTERKSPAIKAGVDEQGHETVSVDPTNKDESIEVSSKMFEMIKLLGAGTFGKVFVVKCLISSI